MPGIAYALGLEYRPKPDEAKNRQAGSQNPNRKATLPIELWSTILSYVDDFTLWVVCRQLSHVLRTEAEREFALVRLKRLKIYWDVKGEYTLNGTEIPCTLFAMTTKFDSASTARRHGKLVLRSSAPLRRTVGEDSTREITHFLAKLFANSDLHFQARFSPTKQVAQVCQIGPYFIDAPYSDGCISTLLDLAFSPFHYAQKKQNYQPNIEDDAEKDLLKRFGHEESVKWSERDVWVSKYGAGIEHELFVEGYLARLRCAHAKANVPFNLGEYQDQEGYPFSYKPAIEQYLDVYRRSRNEYLFGMFVREHGIQMTMD